MAGSRVNFVKVIFSLALLLLWGGIIWIFTHLKRVKQEIKDDDADLDATPRTNLLIWLAIFLAGISLLLLYEIF